MTAPDSPDADLATPPRRPAGALRDLRPRQASPAADKVSSRGLPASRQQPRLAGHGAAAANRAPAPRSGIVLLAPDAGTTATAPSHTRTARHVTPDRPAPDTVPRRILDPRLAGIG